MQEIPDLTAFHIGRRQRRKKQVAQRAAVDFRSQPIAVVRHSQRAGLIQNTHGIAMLQRELAKSLKQTGGPQCRLTGILMNIEHAALGTGSGREIRIIDDCRDPVSMQHARQREAA